MRTTYREIPWRRCLMALLLFYFSGTATARADLNINLIAVNATNKVKEIDVKYYLPKELEPEDIVDSGVLKVDYDVDRGSYFAYNTIEFQPKESKTLKIKVKDVWFISQEEIDVLKKQIDENLKLLEKNQEIYSTASEARDKMVAQLDFILGQQASYSENIDRRIEEYRAYINMLREIRDNAYSLDFFEHEAKSILTEERKETIKLIIQVTNPSKREEKTVKHKHYLPSEVRAEHVVESQGFDVRFDAKKDRAYLTKEELFQPAETKKYEIVIKDIWHLPTERVEALQKRAQVAMDEIQQSMYAESGQFLFDKIMLKAQQIIDSQLQELPPQQHIGLFRVNTKRFEDAEEDLERLEQMLAIVRAKKLEELEGGKVKNILQRMQALRGLAALSEALFKRGISVTVTWRIIFGTLLFVGTLTTIHFVIWSRRSKAMGEEHAGGEIKEVPKPGSEEATEDEEAEA